ncbi:hypothetical protein [Candidatus Nanohalococcus occultus]|uniref:hypothetical protein n=1 Tax=Candidatus Nanohalococcus occultus TaxID=2978047 RepID=UPI0039E1363B
MLDFNFNDAEAKEKVDKIREKPKNFKQKLVRWGRIHPRLSLVTVTILVVLSVTSILPTGFLYFLPTWATNQIIYAMTGGLIGYYLSRPLYARYGQPATETIYQLNVSPNSVMIKPWKALAGKFKNDVEILTGSPIEERRKDGSLQYTVINFDPENNQAHGSHFGDLPQAKMLETREAIRAQFLYNDELRKLGTQINMKLEQIVSKVEYQYANAYLRKMEAVTHPSDLIEDSREGLDDMMVDMDAPDIQDILEKSGIENDSGLEPAHQFSEEQKR